MTGNLIDEFYPRISDYHKGRGTKRNRERGGTAPGIGGGNMSVEISKHIYILSRSYMGCR